MIASINPATGETLRMFGALTESEIDNRITLSDYAYRSYRLTSHSDRARWLTAAAEILESERDRLGRIMTLEMGKPIGAARAEAAKCALACRYYAEHGEELLADEPLDAGAGRSFIRYQPIGTVLAVMPWNFPFWQVFRFAAPALMAGNPGLLKHASNVPQCALAIEDIIRRAGFPADMFQTLLIESRQVRRVIDDQRVRAATLTGSEPAGAQVASQAGRQLKKTVLELGGSDPFLVMPGADLDRAITTAVEARTINNGQSCIAAKRFLVAQPVAEQFQTNFVQKMQALRVGDPMDASTEMGPLSSAGAVADLQAQVDAAVKAGAKVLTGGHKLDRPGCYYAPTVLTNISKASPIYGEEVFGPVACVYTVRDAGEAIEVANDSKLGLGASAWTNDPAERDRFVNEIESGMVFVNKMVASDPRLPFGGVKRSGHGRELGVPGIRELVNAKTIWIEG